MVKPGIIFALVLVALITTPLFLASTDRKAADCQNSTLWLSSAAPDGLVALFCTIQDVGEPVTIAVGRSGEGACCARDSTRESYELAVEDSGLPAETKQLLLFMLALWSQQ